MITSDKSKYMGTVKVGPKGQIVIPKEIRDMFSIETGETLFILADKVDGIAIQKSTVFAQIADAIFKGKAKELYPEHTEKESEVFANKIKNMIEEKDE